MKSVLTTASNVELAPAILPIRTDASLDSKTQPFPYQGSKRSLAPTIIPLLGTCGRVVEPFAGSAAVSIAARAAQSAGPGLIADINAPLMALWREILEAPEALSEAYTELWTAQQDDPKAFRRVKESGKTISEYFLEDLATPSRGGAPRNPIKKRDKDRIVAEFDGKCAVCGTRTSRLQLDHRIPFAIAGDPPVWTSETAMPLCPSDNRAKSWACEHCANWVNRDPDVCLGCMWCHPEDYDHVSMLPERRLVVTAHSETDVETLRWIEAHAAEEDRSTSDVALDVLDDYRNTH